MLLVQDWSQYTPSMLRQARNPALARPQSPLPDENVVANAEEEVADPQLPVDQPLLSLAESQMPVADPQLPTAEAQLTSISQHHQALNTPLR